MRSAPRTVALFYDGYEAQANDGRFGRLRSDLRGVLRQTSRRIRNLQPYTGFYTAFLNLRRSLEVAGIEVRVNDFAYARANPSMPVGITGFHTVFDKVRLPNPAMFGPGEVPDPLDTPPVVEACHLKIVTQPCEWYCDIWRPVLGDIVKPMFVAIDTEKWADQSHHPKDIDVIVYDKIRWYREAREADLLTPLLAHLEARGLSYVVLRYGFHHLAQFRDALRRARALAFLCEHETQGLAYQEAMASGVPVFAWDDGQLVSPHDREVAPEGLVVSSVPYFDARCGLRFRKPEMTEAFDRFWEQVGRGTYRPRDYVCDCLSLEKGAGRYLELFGTLDDGRP
ncbi:glycosyltransferase [Celeribacter indicus]|uniref:Glycosyltransferase n=1 Tax=Celeribacter indicus TaxID=1208324 RepID=A0A0B5DWJ9_9RHOB|nr:glycosyltransferase [Celeribacter indicus]AJE47788.1 hypothetical protein P73_3073 [Celeribacter indicus]SDW22918.1 hypothetical protein SAMN05443573_10258 [Celeribacter indicus]